MVIDYRSIVKPALDRVVSAVALVALAPLFFVIAAVVRVGIGAPVLFRQRRPGLRGQPFTIYKFRTMTEALDEDGRPRRDDRRLTTIGRVLRSTSLDELPELWNVVRGDMSLVGPRPLLMQYLERYSPDQARRHEVRPGLTGLAQINGRNALPWERRFALDVEYVDRCSFTLDLKILAATVWEVVARRNISEPGHATAQEFMGNRPV